jgi:uncharacterized protein with HEPN domain
MQRDESWLSDMLEAALEVAQHVSDQDENQFRNDLRTQRAVERLIAIVGEAAAQVSEETRLELPVIPWRQIVGMRNMLVHRYFNIEISHVWEVVSIDLPQLVNELKSYGIPES